MYTFLRNAGLAGLALGLSLPAHAYQVLTVDGVIPDLPGYAWTFGITDYEPGDWRYDAVVDAAGRWNQTPVDQAILTREDSGWSGLDNTESEMAWVSSSLILGGAPAVCYRWVEPGTYTIDEIDIYADRFDDTTVSNSRDDTMGYGDDSRHLVTLLLHEMGHALGLDHETRYYNIMGEDWDHIHANGTNVHAYAGEDAVNGGVFIHGSQSWKQDVGVVHWKRTGSRGGYSSHSRTVMTDSDGATLINVGSSVEPIYEVRPGQPVGVELTFENNGATNQAVTVDWYYSTNDYVSSHDTFLESDTMTLARNTPYTKVNYGTTIPSAATPGTRAVGAKLWSSVTETSTVNNGTYIKVQVLANGHQEYCHPHARCDWGEGDCDSDSECVSGLQCVDNVGADYGMPANYDVCALPLGHPSYCSPEHPCEATEADCDRDADCVAGLTCVYNVGASYGYPSTYDVCL